MPGDTHGFNEDELDAPKWLNSEFFLKVLKESEKSQQIEVINVNISPASAKGDHYASVMFRAVVDYLFFISGNRKQKSLIIKTMPEHEGSKLEMLKESFIFETEIGMYTEVIPKMESILRAVGDNTEMGPRCLYYTLSPKKVMVFEDLVKKGYEVLRKRLPDMEEVKATYAKLAKWHAVSYKLNVENPKYFDQYCHSIFSTDSIRENDFFKDGLKNFITMLKENDNLHKYVPYFEPMLGKLIDSCIETFNEYRKNPQDAGCYVLCHGDFHLKNLMYKHNPTSGKFEDVLLLDYQVSYVGPSVNDLIYSKFMLLSAEQRANHWDELLHFYFTTFQDTLKKIGFKGEMPSLIEFRKQLMRHKQFEMFLFVTFLPLWITMFDGALGPAEFLASNDTRMIGYRRAAYLNEVRDVLPKYLYSGYLEL